MHGAVPGLRQVALEYAANGIENHGRKRQVDRRQIGEDPSDALASIAAAAELNVPTVQLAEELRDTTIVVNFVSPGHVKTGLTGHNGFITTAEEGAKLPVKYALLGEDAVSGRFVEPDGETPW